MKILIFGSLLAATIAFLFHTPTPDRYEIGFRDGYHQAISDVRIFASGTRSVPNPDWEKSAVEYRLNKKKTESEGIALGLLPDPKTALQPLQ